MPTGISETSIPEISEHYGNLSEFDAMTCYIQELISILEAYSQQKKGSWPPPTDKPCHAFDQESGCTSRSLEEITRCHLFRKDLMRYY